MNKDTVMFRFVPTMRCNFRCDYCFVSNDVKSDGPTMFDEHSVDEWVDGFKKFNKWKIEPYFWGGEPFCIDGTYEFLRKIADLDFLVENFRIDTNIFFAEKIVDKCPSNKIKLNCSFHMQYHSLEEELRKVKLLKKYDMIGMVNFVASRYNLEHLKNDYGMTVGDLINAFGSENVFLNIAGDFKYSNDTTYERYDEYKCFILQFISPDEWKWLRGEYSDPRKCTAGMKMFTVQMDGTFTSCASKKKYGNFFDGVLAPDQNVVTCEKKCLSLVSYPFRTDNQFPSTNSLIEYVNRNMKYRNENNNKYNDFVF